MDAWAGRRIDGGERERAREGESEGEPESIRASERTRKRERESQYDMEFGRKRGGESIQRERRAEERGPTAGACRSGPLGSPPPPVAPCYRESKSLPLPLLPPSLLPFLLAFLRPSLPPSTHISSLSLSLSIHPESKGAATPNPLRPDSPLTPSPQPSLGDGVAGSRGRGSAASNPPPTTTHLLGSAPAIHRLTHSVSPITSCSLL
jgi:hypothetical protein